MIQIISDKMCVLEINNFIFNTDWFKIISEMV